MLEVHYHEIHGENTSEEEDEPGSHCVRTPCSSLEGASLNREPDSICHGVSENLEQDALSLMKKHSDFVEKQTMMAKCLKRTRGSMSMVSSKKPVEDLLAVGGSTGGKQGKRTKTQAEKNRKRKIKKKKARNQETK